MSADNRDAPFERVEFEGAENIRLVGSRFRAGGVPVLLLHGGGQTRHSFDASGVLLARAGFDVFSVDQRGHGESERSPTSAYSFSDFAADALRITEALCGLCGSKPVAVGASLGGLAALYAVGLGAPVSGLVLVDVTPRMSRSGIASIHGFMTARAREGFASVEEASDAIAAYLPHRPRPRSLDGLAKNLRQGPDGRFYWHWDPAFMDGPRPINHERDTIEARLSEGIRELVVPTLLVRGRSSELVSEDSAREFLAQVPHAEYADIAGARHMVAGDSNSAFSQAILDFLTRHFVQKQDVGVQA